MHDTEKDDIEARSNAVQGTRLPWEHSWATWLDNNGINSIWGLCHFSPVLKPKRHKAQKHLHS